MSGSIEAWQFSSVEEERDVGPIVDDYLWAFAAGEADSP